MAGELDAPRGFDDIKALAKAAGRPVVDVLAMAPASDPFYAGQPALVVKGEWFAAMFGRCGYGAGRRTYLRRMHYHLTENLPEDERRLPDGTLYLNDKPCWEYLGDASRAARHLGLIDANVLDDHRNPDPKLYGGEPDPFRDDEPGFTVEEPDDWSLPVIDPNPAWNTGFDLPAPAVTGYGYNPADQPYLLELVIEKSSMDDILDPVCRRYGVNLISGPGFQSITYAQKLLRRVRAAGKPARIFYISDFDPAGERMPVAVARQLEFYRPRIAPGADIKLTQVALTPEQVEAYALPRVPNASRAKDRRVKRFEEVFGEGRVELDALEGVRPGELARLLEEAVAPYFDAGLRERLADAASEAQDEADAAWEDATGDHRAELDAIEDEAKRITARYTDELIALNRRLQEELVPLEFRLAVVRRACLDATSTFAVELPDRPAPESEPPDEGDWLFDAGREYLEQLAHYKERRGEGGDVVIHTDGLTPQQRETVATVRAAGGSMTVEAFAAALGLRLSAGRAHKRLRECVATGLLARRGRGVMGEPRVYCLPESQDGAVEAAG